MELFLFMTTSASLLICIALLLRPLTGRVFPRTTQMILWIAAALRLLIPVHISSPIGIFGRKPVQVQPVSVPASPEVPIEVIPVPKATTLPEPIVPVEPVVSAPAATPEEILFWIWISGIFLMFLIVLFLHIRNLFWCRNKTRDRDAESIVSCTCTVYRCANVKSPFVYGMLRPRIVLPIQLSGSDLIAVLAHEAAHIKRFDMLKKYLFAAALCVHWFNPLVWLMVYFSAQDMEILCDIHALSMPGAPTAKTYAHALLNAEERRIRFNLGFKSNTEVRIMKILKKDKHNRFLMLVSVLLAVLLVTACTTTATTLSDHSTPEPDTSSEAESAPTPTPPPAVKTIVQPLQNKEPAEPVQDLFNRNGVYGFGGLQIGMSWEDAKPIITELTGNEPPVLPETDSYQTSIAFPYSVFGYDGTVTITFASNSKQITGIMCTLPLEGNAAVDTANRDIFVKLQSQLGVPSTSDSFCEIWHLSDCSLVLYSYPIGKTYKEKESVKIQIDPDFSEENTETTDIAPQSVPANPYIKIQSERDAYTALEYIDTKISYLELQRLQIAEVLTRWEQEDEEYLAYRSAALDILGEDANEHDIRVQIAWLKAEDALGFINRSLPDTEGKECMKISIKREDTDEVLSSHIVPKDEYTQYLKEFQSETGAADVYVSFATVE